MKIFIRSFLLFLILVLGQSYTPINAATTATILPLAKTTFLDANGNPLVNGTVTFYIPGTGTLKNTWQDAGEATLNTNPVILDGAGRALIYGFGSYRQVVKDRNGVTIWDQLTASTGSGSGGGTLVGDGNLVGTVLPWSGLVAPAQYVFAYGQEISRLTYSDLFTAITLTQNINCTIGSPTLSGIADTTQLSVGTSIEAACLAPGATVISKTLTTVIASINANITTSVSATFFPWGNGDGSTTFNVPDYRGRTLAGRDNMGGTVASRLTSTYFAAPGLGANGGSQSHTLLLAELAAHTHTASVTDPGHVHSYHSADGTGALSGSGVSGTTITNTASAVTGITVTNSSTGSSTPFSIVQPTIELNYIVKITPDVSTSIATGVASLGGMTGVISCGANLLCTGNVINTSAQLTGILGNQTRNTVFAGPASGSPALPTFRAIVLADLPSTFSGRLVQLGGSGTYTPTAGTLWFRGVAISGGGGGGSSGTGATSGTSGGNTTLVGTGINISVTGSTGGNPGGGPADAQSGTGSPYYFGGESSGGNNIPPSADGGFGGAGACGGTPTPGGSASNTGGGGPGGLSRLIGFPGQSGSGSGGGGGASNGTYNAGSGGAGGSCVPFLVANPSGSYTFAVGGGGTGGVGGVDGGDGGAGATGDILIEEH